VLRNGYDIAFVAAAVCYTETPATIKGFLKQQQRWKRGFIRESIFTLTYAWKTRPLLFFQILVWDLTMPFFTFGMRLAVLVMLLTEPVFFVTSILPMWIIFMLVRYIFVVLRAPQKIPGMFIYMVFYEVFLYWMNLYALFTVGNKSWITR
jgi:cellulose synthase/poly-beta-1,6-N-acetylglucosamine synthase-like glycosyltransferase